MKTKITQLVLIMITMIGMSFAKTTQGQTAHFCIDTLQGSGIIKYCQSDYNQAWLYKPASAHTSIEWQILNPNAESRYTDSILLTSVNTGTISFFSTETGWIDFNFYLVNGPVNPNLPDINACGTIFSYVVNSSNSGINASWIWNDGTITRKDTITTGGIKWVTIANGCGPAVTDSFEVIVDHTNDANLGIDQTPCLGDTITLTTGNTNIVSYHWSTGATTPTLQIWQTGTYSVTTTDNNNCVSNDEMMFTVSPPYAQQELCMVSFDTISYKNMLSWDQHLGVGIDSIEIQKEISLNVWQSIGVVSNTVDTFLDGDSTPQTNSNSYKIMVIDSCHNKSAASAVHTTITLMTSYTPGINVMGFNWSHYMINGALVAPNYTVYGIDSNGVIHIIGTISGSQNYYNWSSPDLTYIKFFVGFTLTCGSKTNYLVRSNFSGNPTTGIQKLLLTKLIKIYPTITNGPITLITDILIQDIKVYNSLGQLLLITKEKHFDIPYKGMCFIHITTEKGVLVQKIIVE